MPSNRVVIPQFDPAIDQLTLEINGEDYAFVIDFALLKRIDEGEFNFDDEEDPLVRMEAALKLIHAGCEARHPDLTVEDVRGWFATPRAFVPINEAVEQYIKGVVGLVPGEDADGQGEAASAGSSSGRGRTTTSNSRKRK